MVDIIIEGCIGSWVCKEKGNLPNQVLEVMSEGFQEEVTARLSLSQCEEE